MNMKNRPRLVKGSVIYNKLKHNTVKGDLSYLVKDSKNTKYAKWLMIAADLDLTFLQLCMLVRIIQINDIFCGKESNTNLYSKVDIISEFIFVSSERTIINGFTRLRSLGYITRGNRRFTVQCTDDINDTLKELLGDTWDDLINYIEIQCCRN